MVGFGLSGRSRPRVERLDRDGWGCCYLYRQIWPKRSGISEKIPEMEQGHGMDSNTSSWGTDVTGCTGRIQGVARAEGEQGSYNERYDKG